MKSGPPTFPDTSTWKLHSPAGSIPAQGEMATLVRSFNWAATPLGPVANWSESLLCSLNLMLACRFPALLFWGPQLIQCYNDAYRPLMAEKHPSALGQPAATCWQEAWHIIGPQLHAVLDRGETVYQENVLVPVQRHGHLQDRFWTYSYSPVPAPDGTTAGIFVVCHDTTGEVLATRELRESEARVSRILQSIGDAVIVTDADTRITRMNPVAEQLTRWPLQDARGHSLHEVFHIVNEETREPAESPADKVKRLGTIVGLANHTILIGRDGTETHIDDSGAPIRSDDGELTGIVLVFRNIEERRAVEKQRDALAQRLGEVLDATSDSVLSIGRDWRITYLNPRAREAAGPLQDALGRNFWEHFPSTVYPGSPYLSHYHRAMDEGIAGQFEAFYPEPLAAWVRVQVRPSSEGIVLFFRDITEEKRAAEALAQSNRALVESEEELQWTVQLSAQIPWTADTEGRILNFSDQWLQLTGLTREQALRNGWIQAPHPEDEPRMAAEWSRALTTGRHYDVEHRIRTASGETVWMRSRAFPRRDQSGHIVKWYGTTEDINARKLSEDALRESQTQLKAIYDTTHEYIGLVTPSGTVIDCNASALSFAGNRREEIVGTSFAGIPWFAGTPGASQQISRAVEHAAAGEFVRLELNLLRPSGESSTFDFSLTPFRDAGGHVLYLIPEGRDITDFKRTQVALLQTEKLAAVGRLAASIAHEINNPLESVTNLLYLASITEDLNDIHDYLETADRELRRVSVISSQTLRFYKQSTSPRPVTFDDLIESVLSIHQGRTVNSRVAIELRDRSTAPVLCFEGEIRQVLNNLVGNAIDAMHPAGGRLLLRSRNARDWRTGEHGLRITIADTGSGMPSAVQRRIFDAFFTTKGIGGTGLGLWVSREIVERHRGLLRVRSSRREGASGTVFSLFLPFDAVTR